MQVTFDTNNAADVAFVRTLLGIPAPAPTVPAFAIPTPSGLQQPAWAPFANITAAHPKPGDAGPAWAPAGSTWYLAAPGVLGLHGPDGADILVTWQGSTPLPGTPHVNVIDDPVAKAQGDALLAVIKASN